jgi:hypothetical protein
MISQPTPPTASTSHTIEVGVSGRLAVLAEVSLRHRTPGNGKSSAEHDEVQGMPAEYGVNHGVEDWEVGRPSTPGEADVFEHGDEHGDDQPSVCQPHPEMTPP